jgi:sulfhydrogenase subunit alpha
MKVKIETLARVEGHGGILVEMEGKRVKNVQFSIMEGPRLVETLTIGKTPAEDISLVCRICAICTTSHRYAAIRALERGLGIQVSSKTHLTRTLMHLGEMVESHSLHVFLLSLPDLAGRSSAIDMMDDFGDEVRFALRMKKLGNSVMALTTDRMIHGENPVMGGFGRFPSRQDLLDIKKEAEELLPSSIRALELVNSFSLPSFFEEETLFMGLKPEGEKFGFVGDKVILSSGEERSIEEYKELTNERVVPHSFSKRSLYNGKPFTLGALARVNVIGERMDGEAGKCFKKYYKARWKKNPLFNILAQALEIVYCLEEIPRLADQILELEDTPIVEPSKSKGEATGAVEAPRGTLYHHYRVEDGLIADTDIITPTAQNLDDVEKYFRLAAENAPTPSEAEIGNTLETIARAYDPCISCSTHLVEVRRTEGEAGTTGAEVWKTEVGLPKTMVEAGRTQGQSGEAEEEIRKAEGELPKTDGMDWKRDLSSLLLSSPQPFFIGLGNEVRSDDGIGLLIARRLRDLGHENVLVENEWSRILEHLEASDGASTIFIDAGDFRGAPGEIRLFPLDSVESELISSHRALPGLSKRIPKNRSDLQYVLTVQPSSTEFGQGISPQVSAAADEIIRFLSQTAATPR